MGILAEELLIDFCKMIVFLRSLDCNPDPRVQKYCDYLTGEGLDYQIFCWDRDMKYSDDKIHTYFHKEASYGTGMKNASGILSFNKFLFKQLYKNRKTYKVIHACDFDTILPTLFFKVFFRKAVIYDIFDWFVDSRHFKNKFIKQTILFIEKIALCLSDAVIICDEERKPQLNHTPKRLWVLPNIPSFNFVEDVKAQGTINQNGVIKLAYVGTMPADRGIDKLLECVKNNPSLELDIAGFGIMSKLVQEYSDKCPNIRFYGTVPYDKGMQLMANSDIIIAIYEKKVLNNVYAAPNKYYEGLYLGKPILTTEGTLVGNHAEKYKTGFVIGETMDEMDAFFKQKDLKSKITEFGQNAKKVWKEKYCNYVKTFMNQIYLPFVCTKIK